MYVRVPRGADETHRARAVPPLRPPLPLHTRRRACQHRRGKAPMRSPSCSPTSTAADGWPWCHRPSRPRRSCSRSASCFLVARLQGGHNVICFIFGRGPAGMFFPCSRMWSQPCCWMMQAGALECGPQDRRHGRRCRPPLLIVCTHEAAAN